MLPKFPSRHAGPCTAMLKGHMLLLLILRRKSRPNFHIALIRPLHTFIGLSARVKHRARERKFRGPNQMT